MSRDSVDRFSEPLGEIFNMMWEFLQKNPPQGLAAVSGPQVEMVPPEVFQASYLVTPGIRMAGDAAGDQRRVLTPADAVANGSDYLVIGRSVTGAQDPLAALQRVHRELGISR